MHKVKESLSKKFDHEELVGGMGRVICLQR